MKKQVSFLPVVALVAALFTVVSCDPKEPVVDDSFSVSPTSLEFKATDASTQYISVTASGEWTAVASSSWIHVKPNAGTGKGSVSVTVDPNDEGGNRPGTISFSGAGTASVSVTQKGTNVVPVVAKPDSYDKTNKLASTTYQLLIYSFADSNGDGIGDFKGIQQKLDYLDEMGVCALWLSPAHPADSYHGYDVTDYYAVNPLYGTEQDFKNLVDAAHQHGIRIYMDYVLNHSGKGHPWFTEAKADPSSKYRDYYFFSSNPSVDYSSFPMLKGTRYVESEWQPITVGAPRLTVTKTDEALTTGSSDWNLWFWQGSAPGKEIRFKDRGDGTMYLVMDIDGSCGMLVRRWMNWNPGSKFGASGSGVLTEGKTMNLVDNGGDISFTGSGRYKIEISDLPTDALYFMGAFGAWMPDLNYGDVSKAETNPCFQDLAASADKWINLGVDGFRLDAVKHICGGIGSFSHTSNQTLLAKWYEHCNATYKAAGHDDNIFMVAEEWDGHGTEKQYYKSLTSCFEFDYWRLLQRVLTNRNESNYVDQVGGKNGFITEHLDIRPDAITSLFMTNHDKSSIKNAIVNDKGERQSLFRAADDLDRRLELEKQAAAMILTTAGKPFIYQGEELGYWREFIYGDKDHGDASDEYMRTPILWTSSISSAATKGVSDKVDTDMLKTEGISVEAQAANANSLLNVYRTFGQLRCTYPALAEGTMSAAPMNGGAIAAWYMTGTDGRKMLVIHNLSGKEQVVTVSDDISSPVAVLGFVGIDEDKNLVFAGNSSVVFKL